MKVLIVHRNQGFHGGAEVVVDELEKHLKSKNVEVKVLSESNPYSLWSKTQALMPWADVVNAHNWPAPLSTFPKGKKPLVWYCNEPPELFSNWLRSPIEAFHRRWIKGSIVVVSDPKSASRFKKIYKFDPKVVPYGIDWAFWSQGERKAFNGTGILKILQVGNISKGKNQEETLRVFKLLKAEGLPVSLTLVGKKVDGSIEIPPVVNWIDHSTPEEVRNLYYSHDILLHPVKDYGGWLAPFEALCTRLPIIVSDAFIGSGDISYRDLGIVCWDYPTYIRRMFKEGGRSWYSKAAERGSLWIKDNLTWNKFGDSMLRVFEEALDG